MSAQRNKPKTTGDPELKDESGIIADANQRAIALAEQVDEGALPDFMRRRSQVVRRPPPMKFGAIDIGTNSIHLMMVEITPDGHFITLGRDKEMVQLGRGAMVDHVLTERAIDDGLAALMRFTKMARLKGIHEVTAFATSAVREAHNGGEFVELVRDRIGLELRVITAEEEARLIYLAVRNSIDLGERDNLIVDVGGGSVEIIVGNAQKPDLLSSTKLGSLRLAETYLKHDPPTMGDLKAMRRQIEQKLRPILKKIGKRSFERSIGTSGTIGAIAAALAHRRGITEIEPVMTLSIERSDLKAMVAEMRHLTREQRQKQPGIDARRADLILPTSVLLLTLMRAVGVSSLQYCDRALREGIVYDYIATQRSRLIAHSTWPDPRIRSVYGLGERCNWRRSHSEQVAKLALSMFDQLSEVHKLGEHYRELLHYGSLLHDIGYQISHRSHHKHSYYLIRNGELSGFTEREIELIANVARYHRKGRPRKSHYSYQNLDARDQPALLQMVSMLRMANALDRTHYSVVDALRCTADNETIRIEIETARDVELELWHARRQAEFFENAMNRKVVILPAAAEPTGDS